MTLFSRVAAELRVSVVELLSGELMNVVRSSNLDEAVDWDGKAAQATPLTLHWTILRIYWFRPTCSAATWSTRAPVSIPAYLPRWFAIESSPGKPTVCEGCAIEWFPWGTWRVCLDEPYTRHGEGYHMKRTP